MSELPLAPLKRIVKEEGRHGRTPQIGKEALEAYRDEVERYARELANKTAIMAFQYARTTIKPHDVEVAAKKIHDDIALEFQERLREEEQDLADVEEAY